MTAALIILGGTPASLRTAFELDTRLGGELHAPIFFITPEHDITVGRSGWKYKYDDLFAGTHIYHLPEAIQSIDTDMQRIYTSRYVLDFSHLVLGDVIQRCCLAIPSGFRSDDTGRLITASTLQLIHHPTIWAIGEGAAVSDCHHAGPRHGKHVARAIDSISRGRTPSGYLPRQSHTPTVSDAEYLFHVFPSRLALQAFLTRPHA